MRKNILAGSSCTGEVKKRTNCVMPAMKIDVHLGYT